MQAAVFPLAVPYLLNPAGIVVLVTASAEAASVAVFAVVVGILIVILALDVAVFRWAVQVSNHLDARPDAGDREDIRLPARRAGRAAHAQRTVRCRSDPPDGH